MSEFVTTEERLDRLEAAIRMLNNLNPMPTHRRMIRDILDGKEPAMIEPVRELE